jgi:CHAP domain
MTPHQQRALALAVSQKGIREHPIGSNDQRYSRYFGFGKQRWCADFVSFCMDMTGNRDRKVPWDYPSACNNIAAWGRRTGKIHSQPRKGDIFIKNDKENHHPEQCIHTGFVLSADGPRFMTIEGNTSGPQASDGYVATHSRDASSGEYLFVGPWS